MKLSFIIISNSESFRVLSIKRLFSEKKKKLGDFPEPGVKLCIPMKLAPGIKLSKSIYSDSIPFLILLNILGAYSTTETLSNGDKGITGTDLSGCSSTKDKPVILNLFYS